MRALKLFTDLWLEILMVPFFLLCLAITWDGERLQTAIFGFGLGFATATLLLGIGFKILRNRIRRAIQS